MTRFLLWTAKRRMPYLPLCGTMPRTRSFFLISHRLYHFPQMQQVIFMEDGKTAVGTHEELMAAVPAYRRLYESQTGGKGHEEER